MIMMNEYSFTKREGEKFVGVVGRTFRGNPPVGRNDGKVVQYWAKREYEGGEGEEHVLTGVAVPSPGGAVYVFGPTPGNDVSVVSAHAPTIKRASEAVECFAAGHRLEPIVSITVDEEAVLDFIERAERLYECMEEGMGQ